MSENKKIKSAFVRNFFQSHKIALLRIASVIALAWLFFRFLCLPMFISGESMLPTYPNFGFTFCWTPSLWGNTVPARGDVVIFSLAGRNVFLLKRVLAFEGETVEWKRGVLYVNGTALDEPYVTMKSETWTAPPERVADGRYYVMGDNRSMPMEQHKGGQIRKLRLRGKPLW